MARCLIIGCGCRGQSLARELIERGHAVRGTTRSETRLAGIEQAGAEGFVGDPDRVGTLASALDQVGVVCILLGSAAGSLASLEALHGPRLEMLLARVQDSPVRGVVYEAAGTVPDPVLARASEIVRVTCERSHIPYVILETAGGLPGQWVASTADGVDRVLGGR